MLFYVCISMYTAMKINKGGPGYTGKPSNGKK